jgi:hypothetical protein
MTHEETHEALKRITYKPNVTIELSRYRNKSSELRIHLRTVCSVTGDAVTITHANVFEPKGMRDIYDLRRFVYNRIKIMEVHEMNEFFRVDGMQPFDPHPEYPKVLTGEFIENSQKQLDQALSHPGLHSFLIRNAISS